MTSRANTIAPYTSVTEAAGIMCECGLNRLPVAKNEQVVGIVTRAEPRARLHALVRRSSFVDVLARTMSVDQGTIDVAASHGTPSSPAGCTREARSSC